MGNKNSTKPNITSDTYNAEPVSDFTKSSIACQRTDSSRIVQNVRLIWLDNSEDNLKLATQLRRVANDINMFTDGDKCIQFIEDITDNKICMIISGSLTHDILPRIHNMPQVDSILIFSDNEIYDKQWTKIKGVFNEIASINEAVKQISEQCEQNAISISFVNIDDDISNKNLDRIDPMFIYTQITKEVLLSLTSKQHYKNEFIEYCRTVFAENEKELENVEKIERNYRDKTLIEWYTYDCFLYPMFNRALRINDVEIIIKMSFFICDLYCQIKQLHKEQINDYQTEKTFTIYRGQGLSKVDFEQMEKTKGGLMSFNNFLRASKNRTTSLRFCRNALTDSDSIGVLFVMTIDPSISTTQFASINQDEILFSMHTIFCIDDIKSIDENHRLFQVDLTLKSENDKDLRMLLNYIRERCFPDIPGWRRLGSILHKMGQFHKSQQVYDIILEHTMDEKEKGNIYCQLGTVLMDQGKYKEAISFYERSIHVYNKTLPTNPLNFATCYNNIGLVYDKMGDHMRTLSYYEKALEIRLQSHPPNHPSVAASYNNIGLVYYNMHEYSKALSCYKKELEISQKSLHVNHPHLGASHNNVGLAYFNMGEYTKALLFHEKALEIRQQAFFPNHPYVAISYNNIGEVYREMGEYSKALSSHEKALEIRQQSLSPNHPNLAASYTNVGLVYYNMGEYTKALSSYEAAVHIREKSLPSNQSDLGKDYNNIGLIYESMGDYSNARLFYERAVSIGQRLLPANHPILLSRQKNLDSLKDRL